MNESLHILLIDDDKDDQFFFTEALKMVSADSVCDLAESGMEGLKFLESKSKPDVIFLDLNMPGMNGFDFLKIIRAKEEFTKIPVVIYTTSSNKADVERARLLRAQAYFTKTADLKTLAEKLEVALDMNFDEPYIFRIIE